MVSIILGVVGVMMFAAGIGLRSLLRSFGTLLASVGGLFLLDGVLGWFFAWTDHQKVLIAGGILLLFSVVTFVWQLSEKFRSLSK